MTKHRNHLFFIYSSNIKQIYFHFLNLILNFIVMVIFPVEPNLFEAMNFAVLNGIVSTT